MFVKFNYEQLQVYGLLYFFWWLPRRQVLATIKVMGKEEGGDLMINLTQTEDEPLSRISQFEKRKSMLGIRLVSNEMPSFDSPKSV